MKRIVYFLIITTLFTNLLFTQQCPNFPTDWGRKLPNSSYTWAFSDFNVLNIVSINGHLAQSADIPIIQSAIRGAVNAWKNAVNSAGVVITFTELPIEQYNSADIKIKFGSSSCGYANPITQTIELGLDGWMSNPDTPYPWGTYGQADKVDLQTITVHELGHLFFGGPEWNNAIPNTVMRDDLCQMGGIIIRQPLSCDVQAVLSFYNPFINITVANSFGGGIIGFNEGQPGGGTFPSGTTFPRRQSTFPHTIRAIDQDFVDPSTNKNYYRVYQNWTKPGAIIDATNPLTITVNATGVYIANFLKLFNVAVTSAIFIEGGSGGSYKVDGVDVGTNWAGTIKQGLSKTLEAIPPSGYIFVGWSDGETANPHNLSPTDHVQDLHAIYKLPLQSTSSTATAYNNSRKISRSPDGKLYCVYESASAIFFIESTDNGATWLPEKLISGLPDANNSYKNPAIAVDDNGNPHVVYEQLYIDGATTYYLLNCRWRDPIYGWSGVDELNANLSPGYSTSEQMPSITAAGRVAVTWVRYGKITLAIKGANWWFSTAGEFTNCEFPSIYSASSSQFHLVWADGATVDKDVYRQIFNFDDAIGITPGNRFNITPSYGYLTQCNHPSTIIIGGSLYLAFSALDSRYTLQPTKSINLLTTYLANNSTTYNSWASEGKVYDYPSVSFSDNKANILFQDITNGNSMWMDNTTNSIPRILEKNSYYPSTIENDVPNATYLFTSGTSAPYQITFKKHDVVVSSQILSGWNMLSVPNIVHDFSKTAVWSGANSAASAYVPGVGYVEKNTLENRIGYWVSFPSAQTKDYAGFPLDSVNIPVVNVGSGWNIIGSISHDLQTSKIYSEPANIIASRFWGYNSGYYISDFIKKGNGYWVKVNNNGKIILDVNSTASSSPPQCSEEPPANPPGAPPQVVLSSPANGTTGLSTTLTLSWNASSGATSYSLQVSSDPCFTTFVFNDTTLTTTSKYVGPLSYSTTYYWRVKPKNNVATGIWSDRWNFTIRSAPYIDPCAPINELSAMDQFSITDNKGNKQSMYAHNGGRKLALGLNDFDMPPSPPKGIFDARFKSGKFIEILVPDQSKKIKPIKIKDAEYPISFSWIVKEDNKTTYWLITGKKEKISLLGSGNVSIDGLENGELSVEAQAVAPGPCVVYKADFGETTEELVNIPTEYGLSQNYPNPFNPVTQISYALPEAGYVTLKVYDVLGGEVATLVDEFKEAVYYEATWDATNIPSGVYFYKLNAGSFTSVRKMILLR
jgi:hypothetical protein